METRTLIYGAVAVALVAAGVWSFWPQPQPATQPTQAQPTEDPFSLPRDITGAIAVLAPSSLGLSATAGKKLFDEKCASCHGADAAGTTSGPPLAHFVYEPSHHGDASFYNAVQNGVKGHHWRYGDMKPVADVSVPQIADIVAYVRSVQKVNGID